MFRYISHWAKNTQNCEDNLNNYLSADDFTLLAKFRIGKYIDFEGKGGFNREDNYKIGHFNTFGELNLDFKFSPMSELTVSHNKSGDVQCEGEFSVWQDESKQENISLYSKTNASLSDSKFSKTFHAAYSHRDQFMINLGINNWEPFKERSRSYLAENPEITAGILSSIVQEDNFSGVGGFQLGFDSTKGTISKIQTLFGFDSPYSDCVLNLTVKKMSLPVLNAEINKENPVDISYDKNFSIAANFRVTSFFLLSTYLSTSHHKTFTTKFTLGETYSIDDDTTFRSCLSDDLSVGLSLTRKVKGVGNLTVATRLNYVQGKKSINHEVHEIPHIRSKLGVQLELL